VWFKAIQLLNILCRRKRNSSTTQQATTTPSSAHDLALQQRVNQSLLKILQSVKITLSGEAKRKHSVFLALSHKCFETAKSIRRLCDDNLCDDAFALLRVIVEGTINAVYILKSDDQVADDYMDLSTVSGMVPVRADSFCRARAS
jgi:hypothetical protein